MEASFNRDPQAFPPIRLKTKIERSRRLWDKYRDLSRRQQRALQKRASARGPYAKDANERTKEKAKLFSETLARFEALLEARQAPGKEISPSQRSARKKASSPKSKRISGRRGKASEASPPSSKRARKRRAKGSRTPSGEEKKVLGRKSKSRTARDARAQRHFEKTRSKAIQAHIRSRGRRHQARRDSR